MDYHVALVLLQILISLIGVGVTWKIFKLLNHGNMWWVMSLGFVVFILNSFVYLLAPSTPFWVEMKIDYCPLIARACFVLSVSRFLFLATKEHNAKVRAEEGLDSIISKIRVLTDKNEMGCTFWNPVIGCQNPHNTENDIAQYEK